MQGKKIFLYTLFSGLGDFLIIGDLIHKIEENVPNSRCIAAHRDNPHVKHWKYNNSPEHFFNILSPRILFQLIQDLKSLRKEGHTVFGLQQAPGSLQGFSFLKLLKFLGAIDYVVDLNLYNADIITPPRGNYILDIHLNQICDLLKIKIPGSDYVLGVPFEFPIKNTDAGLIGIHPWGRRENLSSF